MITFERALKNSGLSEYEYNLIKTKLNREPTVCEIGMFGALWSEHCGYKNTKKLFKMLPVKGKHLLQGPGENAGAVVVDDYAIVFKIESHNHPSAVEPYEGAATGVGGILRDVFAMGARPIAVLDSLRFGKIDSKRTRYLVNGIISGISDYGNRVGIPTVAGEVVFDDAYEGNPLVNVMCVGIIEKDRIIKAIAKGKGNLLFYYGSKTGRDGLGGATFSSAELSSEGEDMRPSVQVGDAFTEKLILEATLEIIEKNLVIGIQDMGAAGITSSSVEMASKGKSGIEIYIDNIPARAENMSAYEFLLSESQERMLACVEPDKLEEIEKIMKKYELDYAVIGKVVDGENVKVIEKGKIVADIPIRFLTDEVPMYEHKVIKPSYIDKLNNEDINLKIDDYNEVLKKLLSHPNIASKEWVYERYDYMVQTNILNEPKKAGGALLRIKNTNKAIAVATDGNGRYMYLDPYKGAMIAVAEACRNISCMGAEPYGITNNLNFGNPYKSDVYYQIYKGIEGMSEACKVFEIPITGGNSSLNNETDGIPIIPTIVIGVVGVKENYYNIPLAEFSKEDNIIALLGENKDEAGGSLALQLLSNGRIYGKCPDIDLQKEKRLQQLVRELVNNNLVNGIQDVSEGGLAIALLECLINGKKGAMIEINSNINPFSLLFGETQSRVVIAFDRDKENIVADLSSRYNIEFTKIGKVNNTNRVKININDANFIDIPIEEAISLYHTKYC